MYNKVFISYATEDYSFAINLYNFLIENNFKPWLDKKDLLPGQGWDFHIKKALREANYIILLLSETSVQKRGYVQREFKAALDFVQEKLDDDIYLIPVKIDKCNVPDKLNQFQWIEYVQENCFDSILDSLTIQQDKYLQQEKKQIAANLGYAYTEQESNFEYKGAVKFHIESSSLQFSPENNTSIKELNAIIKGRETTYVAESRKHFYTLDGILTSVVWGDLDWGFGISFHPNLISKEIISINENSYQYTGGAHGVGFISGLNYNLYPLYKIELQDLFDQKDHEAALKFISEFCYEELRKIHNEFSQADEEEISQQTPDTLFWEGSLAPKWSNFESFFISKNSLEIIFNSYSVSGYAFGVQIISIPYEAISTILTNPTLIQTLVRKIQS